MIKIVNLKIDKVRLIAFLAVLLFFLNLGVGFAQNQHNTEKSKLVVLIVIDAFRYDYLSRFNEHFGEKGFNYFLSNGAIYNNEHVTHFRKITATVLATMLAGSSGATKGFNKAYYSRQVALNDLSV